MRLRKHLRSFRDPFERRVGGLTQYRRPVEKPRKRAAKGR